MRLVLAVALGLSLPALAFARGLMFCSEPSSPYCLDSLFDFSECIEFDLCRDEVQRFVDAHQGVRRVP